MGTILQERKDRRSVLPLVALIIGCIMFVFTVMTLALSDEGVKQHRIMDGVMTIDDIPEGECRYVQHPPRPLDRMELPTTKMMCKTLGVVIVEDVNR